MSKQSPFQSNPTQPGRLSARINRDKLALNRRQLVTRAVFIGPGTLWLCFFVVIPLILITIYSFGHRGPYGGVQLGFTLENYVRLLDPVYFTIFWRSAVLAFATTVLCLLMGYPLAYGIVTMPAPWRTRLLLLVVIPFWTNFLIRTYAWIIILREEGLLNSLLSALHLISTPLTIMYTPWAVLIGFVYTWLPFAVLPLYASLEKLDRSLIEAAQDLGASGRVIFRRVIWPLTIPGVVAASIMIFVPALAMFVIPDLMGGATTLLVGNLIKNQFLSARHWPFGSAVSVVLILLMLLLLAAYVRLARFGREEGS